MKYPNHFILSLLLLVTISSCDDPTGIDQTIPTTVTGTVTPNPSTGFICGTQYSNIIYAISDNEITIPLYLRDDTELSHYTLVLQENFNCQAYKDNINNWEIDERVSLSGNSVNVEKVLTVPTNVTAGLYNLTINLWDAAGNQATTVHYYLDILNNADTEAPILAKILPNTNIVTINNGDILNIQGTLSDNSSLRKGLLQLSYTDADNNKIEVWNSTLDHTNNNRYDYDLEYTIPADLTSGSYNFELYGYDMVGNRSNKQSVTVVIP